MATRSKTYVCGRSLAGIAGSNFDGDVWMFVFCCVWSDLLCVVLITRPGESYRVRCVWARSLSLDNEEAMAHERAVAPWTKYSHDNSDGFRKRF